MLLADAASGQMLPLPQVGIDIGCHMLPGLSICCQMPPDVALTDGTIFLSGIYPQRLNTSDFLSKIETW